MPRYAFRVEYDGAPFSGWQAQRDLPSVQGAIETALGRLDAGFAHGARIAAAGRTDAGVHASSQVFHADLLRDWSPFRLSEALNWHLSPAPVAITAVVPVGEEFHARFSALERRYSFRIVARRAPVVADRGRVWHVRQPLDVDAMRHAAAHLVGRHDFTTFRSAMCQSKSPVKTLDQITITTHDYPAGQEIRFFLRARSFLHNQVRSIVGTLERVGVGAWPPERVATALAARDRAACGPVSPPQGLSLDGVTYDPDPFT